MKTIYVVRYTITKENICMSVMKVNMTSKEAAQNYIHELSNRADLKGYKPLKTTKNTFTCSKVNDSNGGLKILFFKAMECCSIPINPKDVKNIQVKFFQK